MGILLFIIIVVFGAWTAFRLLAPEMYLSIDRSKLRFPWQRTQLNPDSTIAEPIDPEYMHAEQPLPPVVDFPIRDYRPSMPAAEKVVMLETLLLEKNKLIDRLSTEIDAERSHRGEFNQVKDLMTEEILRLKKQMKELKQNKEQLNA